MEVEGDLIKIEEEIIELLKKNPDGASTSYIADATSHTRSTSAKYLELMKLKNKVDYRTIGKAKLWVLTEKRKKILIAEDEEHVRRLIKIVLEQEDYDFIEAKDGKDALEKVSEEMPDLIILDLMMPKIDGIEVCRQLKKNALTRKVPVIMLTAKREIEDRIVGIKAGADDYLPKPFDTRELRVRVKNFLDKKKSDRNQITNLPTYYHVLERLKGLDKSVQVYLLSFKNLDIYKKEYGLSKLNEFLRLTAQIITYHLEKYSRNNFAGHDNDNNFIVFIDDESKNTLKDIQKEFESTKPFFYDLDYGKKVRGKLIQLEIKKYEDKEPL